MRSTVAQGLDIIEIDRANFPLSTLGDTLHQIQNELIEGRNVTGDVNLFSGCIGFTGVDLIHGSIPSLK
jgi:hypothetical protein